MTSLSDYLDSASRAYYEGTPIIEDEVFDRLAESIKYEKVGAKAGDKPHAYPLFSLQKVFVGEDEVPSNLKSRHDLVRTVKLDGASISVLYLNGALVQVLTRGDGVKGKDITSKFLEGSVKLPRSINYIKPLQLNIEVVAPIVDYIKNPRNYAAGALNLKDLSEFETRELFYYAHGAQPYITDTYMGDMKALSELGFRTILENVAGYPTDGAVYRVDNNKDFSELGYTAHHPRGAYALKERKAGVVTKLLDVVWQVGKSGKVSPVAILEPVDIDGAIIQRATLHNPGYIKALGLSLGDRVEVARMGEIIPGVIRKVT